VAGTAAAAATAATAAAAAETVTGRTEADALILGVILGADSGCWNRAMLGVDAGRVAASCVDAGCVDDGFVAAGVLNLGVDVQRTRPGYDHDHGRLMISSRQSRVNEL
jgi:hypothetical protein